MSRLDEVLSGGGVYCIAEMSANHAGSIDNAFKIVDAAAEAGADCLKIQTYTADTLTLDSDKDYFLIKSGLWKGRTLHDLYEEAYTPWEWQADIKSACEAAGMDFLSTPFDKTAVDFLEGLGVGSYKIASYELVDIPLISYVASKHKPIIMSCGMGTVGEIEEALDACRRQGNDDVILLKCCSEYPANFDDMNISVIADMRERFGVRVGLSDHSPGSAAAVASVGLGARVIEKHFCLSRAIENPDSSFSMEPAEFASMVRDVRLAARAMGRPTYELSETEQAGRSRRRSIFACRDISAGDVFTEENCRSVRPGCGLEPKYFEQLLGTVAKRDIEAGEPITHDDFGA